MPTNEGACTQERPAGHPFDAETKQKGERNLIEKSMLFESKSNLIGLLVTLSKDKEFK